ncbi:hypothetical protein C8R47DRAFT_960555, partial [Mycena vitilis]
WDFWPDGRFQSLVSTTEVADTYKLATNWILETVVSRGSPGALTWQKGHELRRRCAGIIECHNDTCNMRLAPATRGIDRYTQLQHPCPSCGDGLIQVHCGIESSLFRFRDGALFIHQGTHNHLTFSGKRCMRYSAHADGPGPSVANISPLLVNAERIKYERRKQLGKASGGYGGDNFLNEFAKFEAKNPEFIRHSRFGQVTVIVMQTPFMASRLIKSVPTPDNDAVGGLVSDAAHGFWRVHNSLLIITSIYEPLHLKCWVPVLISYSNGGTEQHYQAHFFELFLSFARECERLGIALTDEMFANVSRALSYMFLVSSLSNMTAVAFIATPYTCFWCHHYLT